MIKNWLSINPALAKQITNRHILFAALTAYFAVPTLCGLIGYPLTVLGNTMNPRPIVGVLILAGTLSFFVSWLGFLLAISIFKVFQSHHIDGWLPTLLLGAVTGPSVASLFLGIEETTEIALFPAALGVAHALVFFISLIFISKPNTQKSSASV